MKSLSLFSRFFIAFLIWTVGFLSLATYAGGKVFEHDPQFAQKLKDRFNIVINTSRGDQFVGISLSGDSSQYKNFEDSWSFAGPKEKLMVATKDGRISIRKSATAKEVLVRAQGRLDLKESPHLLKTEVTESTLTLSEANGVKDLDIQIEVPEKFHEDLDLITVSGDINVENLSVSLLDLKTVSGDVSLANVTADKAYFKSVSGDATSTSTSFKRFDGKTVSGDLDLVNLQDAPMDFYSVSGNVTLKLNESKNRHFVVKSASGNIENKHASNKNGDVEVSVTTTSGDIEIE